MSQPRPAASFLKRGVPAWSLILVGILAVGSVVGAIVAGPQLANVLSPKPIPPAGDFALSASQSHLTVGQGSTATDTFTVKSVNGFNNSTGLTVATASDTTGLTLSLNSVIITPPANGSVNSTLTVSASYAVQNGNYMVTVTAISGAKTHSFQLTVSVLVSPAFTVTANPSIVNVARGGVNTTRITVTSLYGFSGTVAMTFTSPFALIGVAAGVGPLTISGGTSNSTIVAISTANSTLVGKYYVNVTGTSGAISRSTTITANVTSTIVSGGQEALALDNYVFNSGTNVTLQLHNFGTTSIHLVSYTVSDASGDHYTLTTWAGPTISPGSVFPTNILIGSSCSSCTLSGSPFTFVVSNTYHITVVTARNNQFSWTVTR